MSLSPWSVGYLKVYRNFLIGLLIVLKCLRKSRIFTCRDWRYRLLLFLWLLEKVIGSWWWNCWQLTIWLIASGWNAWGRVKKMRKRGFLCLNFSWVSRLLLGLILSSWVIRRLNDAKPCAYIMRVTVNLFWIIDRCNYDLRIVGIGLLRPFLVVLVIKSGFNCRLSSLACSLFSWK